MKTMTVREVPDEVYTVICREAKVHHRSIQEQVRYILEKDVRLKDGGFATAARTWRTKLAGRDLGDSVADIRAGRKRL